MRQPQWAGTGASPVVQISARQGMETGSPRTRGTRAPQNGLLPLQLQLFGEVDLVGLRTEDEGYAVSALTKWPLLSGSTRREPQSTS